MKPAGHDEDDAAPPLRLFFALWPSGDERAAAARWQRSVRWPPRAAQVPPDRLHVTLHFLGAVPPERLAPLCEIAVAAPPFLLRLDRFAEWPGGLAVIECAAPPPELIDLHARLGAALRAAGFPTERRPLRPHLTLARHAPGAVPPAEPPDLVWQVGGHVLVQSAGDYRVRKEWRWNADRQPAGIPEVRPVKAAPAAGRTKTRGRAEPAAHRGAERPSSGRVRSSG